MEDKRDKCDLHREVGKETWNTWNKVANLYEEKFMYLDLYNDTYSIFCELIKKQSPRILEIGCGPGNICKYKLSKRPDFNIFGIDFAPTMIHLAKKNCPTASFKVMDSRDIDQIEIKFQGIVCGFILPYLSENDRLKLIKDAKNLLTEKGILYISFVEGDYNDSEYKKGSRGDGDRMFFYYHELEKLKSELFENNFQIKNTIHVKYGDLPQTEIHTIIIAELNQ